MPWPTTDPDAPHAPTHPARLVLASGSPRRRHLLSQAGLSFEVVPADIPEEARPGEAPTAMAERLAQEKALAVVARLPSGPIRPVLAADTIVVIGDEVLGKPDDAAHAVVLLSKLVGRSHVVITGVALAHGDEATPGELSSFWVASTVRMRTAERSEIERYVAGGEPMDKAGAYAIQGEGRKFVIEVEGSETNVIGLPMEETLALLSRAGLPGAKA